MTDNGQVRIIIIRAMRCPRCGGPWLKVYSTHRVNDQWLKQYRRCLNTSCNHRFVTMKEDVPAQPSG